MALAQQQQLLSRQAQDPGLGAIAELLPMGAAHLHLHRLEVVLAMVDRHHIGTDLERPFACFDQLAPPLLVLQMPVTEVA